MKKIIIACALLLRASSIFAQHSGPGSGSPATYKNEISINAGIGTPGGNFSRADYSDPKSGFARSGPHFNLSAAHDFKKNWGINLLIGTTQFRNTGSLSLANGYKEDSGTDSTTLYTRGHNYNFSVMAGPVLNIPAGKKFMVKMRALLGYSNTHLQGFQIFYEDYTDNILTQKEASAGAFAFQAGAGIKYTVVKTIAILANLDYYTSRPDINISYDNYLVTAARKITEYHETIRVINATLGISLNF